MTTNHTEQKSSFFAVALNIFGLLIVILGAPGFILGWMLGRESAEVQMKAILANEPAYIRTLDYDFDQYRRRVIKNSVAADRGMYMAYYDNEEPLLLGLKLSDISPTDQAKMMSKLTAEDLISFSDRTLAQHWRAAFAWVCEYYIVTIAVITLFLAWRISCKYRVWKRRYFELREQMEMERVYALEHGELS